jgi:vacuolar protein sorting-associated protein 8
MSASSEERQDASGEEMTDMADPAAIQETGDEQQAPEDDVANHHISDLLEEERQQDSTLPPSEGNGLAHRYKELAAEEHLEATSDNGSVDALPRRAGSPVDSMVSIPDRSPSVQVTRSTIPFSAMVQPRANFGRALVSPLPVAASFHRSPRDHGWEARPPPSDPSTAASSPAYLRRAICPPGPPLPLSCQATVGMPP